MNDPTYVDDLINANPAWKLAFFISEIENASAPIGWGRYIYLAESLIAKGYKEKEDDN